jgi:hypothetical protein
LIAGGKGEATFFCDYNGDGETNILDMIRLKKFLAGADT